MHNDQQGEKMPLPSQFFRDSIFWIDVDKIKPNPFQPRKEFDDLRLRDLSESIRMYGVLQPLVVTRREIIEEGKGLTTEYELISGERRLRASKLAGLTQVPALIRQSEDDDRTKLELAIIENLQREDLNAVDRARAFERLVTEFGFKHTQIAQKMGKSREYVTNSLRLLALPPDILDALSQGRISEGHTRPLLMLSDRPDEQNVLFKEILLKKLTVREAEMIARKVAVDRVRKKNQSVDPEILAIEERFRESLGTRVHIERRGDAVAGGKITIDFFSPSDLHNLLELMTGNHIGARSVGGPGQVGAKAVGLGYNMLERQAATPEGMEVLRPSDATRSAAVSLSNATPLTVKEVVSDLVQQEQTVAAVEAGKVEAIATDAAPLPAATVASNVIDTTVEGGQSATLTPAAPQIASTVSVTETKDIVEGAPETALEAPLDDRSKQEKIAAEDDASLYDVKNFTI